MTDAAIELTEVRKSYGPVAALCGISLTVPQGVAFGLVGANGAGKTTLIKCMLDFVHLDGGTIRLLGVTHRSVAARRPLAYLPENFLPFHHLTGREFLRYLQTLRGEPYSDEEIRAYLSALDFDPAALDRLARTYSKGMTRKLGLAACLASRARLFVLDEPMSGLDPKARALLKRELAALTAAGRTVFMSTHSLADVEELCAAMAILHDGRLRFAGTPAACREQFASPTLEEAYLAAIG